MSAMKRSRRGLDTESWAFALEVYKQPRVAESCLALQAEAGVDIIILLFAAFSAVRHHVLFEPSDLAEIDSICSALRGQNFPPLPAFCGALKVGAFPPPHRAAQGPRSKNKARQTSPAR